MMDMVQVGSDFSGVGAFNQALNRLGIKYNEVFACDMDKYARKTFIENYGVPKYYPADVYKRCYKFMTSLDIYMTSPPCQGFSIAGKREGSILFYNSHEFIQKNKPRYFIFENVKGLLSHENGETFQTWIDYLGGKTVNGNPIIFPHEDSVPYHIYHKVLNAKNYGVPQNRERIFIIGIRDDCDNTFTWPKEEYLTKRLKDVLENEVDEKYYLSDKLLSGIIRYEKTTGEIANVNKGRQSGCVFAENSDYISTLSACDYKMPKSVEIETKIGAIRGRNPQNPLSRVSGLPTEQMLEINENGTSNALTTVQKDNVVVFGNLKGGKWDKTHEQSGRVYDTNGIGATIHTMGGGNQEPKIIQDYKIRRLTPRECFRLMDFPDTFKMPCSDSQMYKQAGNSIVVACLEKIIAKLNL